MFRVMGDNEERNERGNERTFNENTINLHKIETIETLNPHENDC